MKEEILVIPTGLALATIIVWLIASDPPSFVSSTKAGASDFQTSSANDRAHDGNPLGNLTKRE